jgi:hypothetical protein
VSDRECRHGQNLNKNPGPWEDFDGSPLKFADGDYVRIDTSKHPESAASLPFLSGYVRGYDLSMIEGVGSAAYELFKVGHNPLCWVKEEFLVLTPGQFGISHGKGAHTNGESCHLCGANL